MSLYVTVFCTRLCFGGSNHGNGPVLSRAKENEVPPAPVSKCQREITRQTTESEQEIGQRHWYVAWYNKNMLTSRVCCAQNSIGQDEAVEEGAVSVGALSNEPWPQL